MRILKWLFFLFLAMVILATIPKLKVEEESSKKQGETSVTAATPTPIPLPGKEFWPSKVHLYHAQSLSKIVPGASISVILPAGAFLPAELTPDHKSVIVSHNELSASVQVSDTDFWKVAQENQKQDELRKQNEILAREAQERKEKQLAEIQRIKDLKEYGASPVIIAGGGLFGYIPIQLKRSLQSQARDPDSMKIRWVGDAVKTEIEGVKCWEIDFQISARNGFGGLTTQNAHAWMRGEQLVALKID